MSSHVFELQELSLEVEASVFGPRAFDDVDPLLRELVARIVLALGDAEHFELTLVPADDQVHSEAALADVIRGHELLGRNQRMEQGCMHGPEHGDPPGRAEQAHRPGDSLQRAAVEIGMAAIACPTADWQHEIDPGSI